MKPAVLDLDAGSREVLEFDDLLEGLADLAVTAGGRREVLALTPCADEARVRGELEAVEEVRAFTAEEGRLLAGGLPDPGSAIRALGIDGTTLDLRDLRVVAQSVKAAGDLGQRLSSLSGQRYPGLRTRIAAAPELQKEAGRVLRHVDAEGRLDDGASSQLRAVRNAQSRVAGRLRTVLERHLRDPDAGSIIRDDFITRRNDRFVIPVRSDAPRPVRGIVHGSSSSGATRFVEPLDSVELNNELVQLAEAEREEVEHIARSWSEAFRVRIEEVLTAVRALDRLDSLQARALFARQSHAVQPVVLLGGPLVIESVRHPLLERRLSEEGRRAVPFNLSLDPADQILVLSGPNAGGKTVTLKTLGLIVLMAQSGIPVPAVEARLPLYRQVRADIGDHQSIQADLSTYSAHVRAVARFLREAAAPALFLFDEIGTGTEPSEGAALARAILEELVRPGMSAVATTHHASVKAWAFGTPGVTCAALEFDTESLCPTFRVLQGIAGVSAGLDIAARLGLGDDIVKRARAGLAPETIRAEASMERMRELTMRLEEERAAVELRGRELAEARRELDRRSAEIERTLQGKAARQLDRAIAEFRRKARAEVAAIADKRQRRRGERELSKAEGRLALERARVESILASSAKPPETSGWNRADSLREGMSVYVSSIGKEGTVKRVRGEEVEVLLGSMSFCVQRSDLRVRGEEVGARRSGSGEIRVSVPLVGDATSEVHLLGKRVDEALDVLDKFLDTATVIGRVEVRVIHGHGTGRLKQAVREFLAAHVHVESCRPGGAVEGGDGATIVKLK